MKLVASIVVSVLLLAMPTLSFAPTAFTVQRTRLNLMGPEEVNALMSSSVAQSDLLPTGAFDSIRETALGLAKEGGPPIMALAVAISDTLPLVPTQPISIIAGALFGLKLGLPAVLIGQAIATSFALLFGRHVLANSEWNVFEETGEGQDRSKLAKVLDELTSGLNSGDPKTVFLDDLTRASNLLSCRFLWVITLSEQQLRLRFLPVLAGNYRWVFASQSDLGGCWSGRNGRCRYGSIKRFTDGRPGSLWSHCDSWHGGVCCANDCKGL